MNRSPADDGGAFMSEVAQRTRFVGRAAELALLDRQLAAATQGRGGVALLAGEPGIGKTRLADELARRATERGGCVLWGRCYEGEGAPAFWPWTQIVRAYLADTHIAALQTSLGPAAADLATLLPDLVDATPEASRPVALSPEQARFRLFEAVASLLRAAAARPLLLLLDDLHWADTASLLLFQFLAREVISLPVLLVGTYRESEADRHRPLSQTVATLARVEGATHLSLSGLSAAEVGDHLGNLLGAAPSVALVAGVAGRTEGNPFFVGELARLLVAAPRPAGSSGAWEMPAALPPGARAVLDQRLAALSPACLEILRAAAVIGRDFRLDVLVEMSADGADAVLDALEEAEAARIVAPPAHAGGRYRFGHALIQEALYAGLPAARRLRLHRRICETMERLYGPDPGDQIAELAHHCRAAATAGEAAKAVTYARRAGDRAMSRLAYEEAARQYGAALESLALVPAPDPRERASLLLALGGAQNAAGETDSARATFTAAAADARALAAPALLARAALGFGGERVTAAGIDRRRVALLEEALADTDAIDPAVCVRLLIRLSEALRTPRDIERRRALSEEAVTLARGLADRRLLAAALGARRDARWGPDGAADLSADMDEIRALADATADPALALQAQQWAVLDLLARGELAAADAAIARFASLADSQRDPFARWQAAAWRVLHPQVRGQFAEAETLAAEALALGERVNRVNARETYQHQVSGGRVLREGWSLILPALTEAVTRLPDFPTWRASLALAHADSGRFEESRREFEHLAVAGFADLPRHSHWHYLLAILARTCALLGDRPRAALLYAQLEPFAGRAVFIPDAMIWHAATDHWLGLLAATLGRWDAAERHFDAALALYARNDVPVWAARSQHAYATMLLTRGEPGDDDRARALLAEALSTANRFGMPTVAALVRSARQQLAGRVIPHPSARIPPPAPLPDGLTAREVEVLRLLAAGESNREIATALVLSVRTVERHSANLYAKIGAHSKAEAAAYAARLGLV